jgi:hypothetical protein
MKQRQLIQISATTVNESCEDCGGHMFSYTVLYGLANDGSVWILPYDGVDEWQQLPALPSDFVPAFNQ